MSWVGAPIRSLLFIATNRTVNRKYGCPRFRGPRGLGVPNERFLFAGVKGQVFVCGVAIPRTWEPANQLTTAEIAQSLQPILCRSAEAAP